MRQRGVCSRIDSPRAAPEWVAESNIYYSFVYHVAYDDEPAWLRQLDSQFYFTR